MSQGANKDDIISAGETALVCLYNGNPHHGINVLRYEKLCVKNCYKHSTSSTWCTSSYVGFSQIAQP